MNVASKHVISNVLVILKENIAFVVTEYLPIFQTMIYRERMMDTSSMVSG